MIKLSAEKVRSVINEAPNMIRGLVQENGNLREKLASAQTEIATYRRRDRIEKIARIMTDKSIGDGDSIEENVAILEKAAEAGKSLDVIEEAVGMSASQVKLGSLGEDEVGNGISDFESYILG